MERTTWIIVAVLVIGLHVGFLMQSQKERPPERVLLDLIELDLDIVQPLASPPAQDSAQKQKLAKREEERQEQERLAKLEEERQEQERLAKLEEERLEQERLAKREEERQEQERLAKLEEERLEKEKRAKILAAQRAKAAAEREQKALATKVAKAAYAQSKRKPYYPKSLLRKKIEGVVKLTVSIDAQGKVAAVKLYKSSGHEAFDESALKSAQKWRYKPALNGLGQPLSSQKTETIIFKITP